MSGEKKGIRIVYDKPTDRSEAATGWVAIKGKQEFPGVAIPLTFAANYRFPGQESKSSGDDFGLLFNYSARSWMFLLHHRLIFLVDGETLDFGDGSYSTKPTGAGKNSGVSEAMHFVVKHEQLEKIVNGKQVEFQIGGFAALLNYELKAMLKEILSLSPGK